MLRHFFNLILISLVFAAGRVEAQVVRMGNNCTQETVGDTNVLVQHHCSTSDEGLLRGKADLVRSYGQAARAMAQAEVYAAQAREQELQNRQLITKQYYERKEMYAASKSHSEKSDVPYVTVSKNDTPKVSTPVVSEDGRISWPVALKSETYRTARQILEIYFSHHGPGYESGVGTTSHKEVRSAIGEMNSTLKSHMTDISSGDYVAAKNFLKNLEKAAG